MNLTKLFEMQKVLDERIIKEKGLVGRHLLPMRILALQVELGELANEWRWFKFWSDDREPRYEMKCHACNGLGKFPAMELHPNLDINTELCMHCDGTGIQERPLLEEYVDCLHFILSIGLEIHIVHDEQLDIVEIEDAIQQYPYRRSNITEQFQSMFYFSTRAHSRYEQLFNCFVQLGKMLGFTWTEIEQAYMDKNKINHERQRSGY